MAAENPSFNRDQISRAEQRIGISHPVINTIDLCLPLVTHLNHEYDGIDNNQAQQRFILANYGFLADALVAAGHYTLKPLEIVAIWSRALEVFSGYQKYAFGGIVSSAYAIQGLKNPEWQKVPRRLLETGRLPQALNKDRDGLLHIKGRLDEIDASLRELDFYTYGTREAGTDLAARLSMRIRGGDLDAKEELDRLISHYNEHKTNVLSHIHENVGTGLIPVYGVIRRALKMDE